MIYVLQSVAENLMKLLQVKRQSMRFPKGLVYIISGNLLHRPYHYIYIYICIANYRLKTGIRCAYPPCKNKATENFCSACMRVDGEVRKYCSECENHDKNRRKHYASRIGKIVQYM